MVWDRLVEVYAFVMTIKARDKPSELAPAPWPDVPSPDPIGERGRQFVVNLREAIGGDSIRSVAARTSVGHPTLLNILSGRVWPDFVTVAKLEQGLRVQLLPPAQFPEE